jgi:two-component system sensor histidine kinase RegB
MWAAFGVAAAFIVIFVTRVARALSRRDAELARSARLASLATLAAGAAHELSTPLGTIAIAARELDRRLERLGDAPAREDAALIRSEVERCRVILEQLASDAGQAHGAASGPVTVRELLDLVTDGRSLERQVPGDVEARLVSVPLRPLGRALRGLVENAVHAAGAAVSVRCAVTGHELTIEIADRGPGMSDEVLARAGEPFFTTREAGHGMGLGIFLARSVLERVGGRLDLTTRLGHGTRAVAVIPLVEPA